MNLNVLSSERKLYFLNLVKTGEVVNHPIDNASPELMQMAKAGYFEKLDAAMPGRIIFRPTQALRVAVSEWDEATLRHQDQKEQPQGLVGGCNFGYA